MAVQPRDATPQRPRAHVIADLSVNHVERYFIAAGHVPTGVPKDYGYDITVVTHDRRGNAENGVVYLQLKASERLTFAPGTRSFPFHISRRHYNLWRNEIMPVFLVRYSAGRLGPTGCTCSPTSSGTRTCSNVRARRRQRF